MLWLSAWSVLCLVGNWDMLDSHLQLCIVFICVSLTGVSLSMALGSRIARMFPVVIV